MIYKNEFASLGAETLFKSCSVWLKKQCRMAQKQRKKADLIGVGNSSLFQSFQNESNKPEVHLCRVL